MKNNLFVLGVCLVVLALTGCGLFSGGPEADLDGTSWTLEMYGGEPLIAGTAMTAEFAAGEIRGSASCNQYFGSYEISGDQITLEGLGWTEMACMDPEGIMQQESAIMAMLSKATSYRIEGGKLYFQVNGGEELVFSALEN